MKSVVTAGLVFAGAMVGGVLSVSLTGVGAQDAPQLCPHETVETVTGTVDTSAYTKETAPAAVLRNSYQVALPESVTREAAEVTELAARGRLKAVGELTTDARKAVALGRLKANDATRNIRWQTGVATKLRDLARVREVESAESSLEAAEAHKVANPTEEVYDLSSFVDLQPAFGSAGTFQVVATEFGPIKVDTRTGATWNLVRDQGGLTWKPIDGGQGGYPTPQPGGSVPPIEIPSPMVRAYLGVSVESAGGKGVRITEIHAGTAAEAIGLKVGDLILSADGVMLSEQQQLGELISKKSPGESITLKLQRSWADPDGVHTRVTIFELEVTLGRK